MQLLGTSYKIDKSNFADTEYLTKIMYLSPHKLSGKNYCANASPGCIAACLNTSGRGKMNTVQQSRLKKSKLFNEQPKEFFSLLQNEIRQFIAYCKKRSKLPAVRLNGTSDIPWEVYTVNEQNESIIELFPQVQFYDYTKSVMRMQNFLTEEKFPRNYHLTFSRSENNDIQCVDVLRMGGNVAAVFKQQLPQRWKRFKVHDGDKTDLRFLDPRGVIGLLAKGRGKKDLTGFVIQ